MLTIALKAYLAITATLAAEQCYQRLKTMINNKKQNPFILKCNGISFNMKLAPHLLVGGLSGQGKSKFVEYLFKDRKDIKNIYLLNAYKDDFKAVNCNRINDTNDILTLLTEHSEGIQGHSRSDNECRYIIIDEMLELAVREKKIMKEMVRALSCARHSNTFFICIAQQATKEEIPCKNLFNCRVSFSQIEYQSYQNVLGYSPEEKHLNQREYFYRTECKIGRGTVPKFDVSQCGTVPTDYEA